LAREEGPVRHFCGAAAAVAVRWQKENLQAGPSSSSFLTPVSAAFPLFVG
jgi:hypothetical protein